MKKYLHVLMHYGLIMPYDYNIDLAALNQYVSNMDLS